MRATDPVHTVTGTIQRESDKAILIRINSIGGRPFVSPRNEWFPFSQVNKIHRNPNLEGDDYIITSEWIITQKGLLADRFYKQPEDVTPKAIQVEEEQTYDGAQDDLDDIAF